MFDPLWASAEDAALTIPSDSRRVVGFSCGPADPGLFNFLFQELQSQVNSALAGNPVQTSRKVDTSEGLKGGGDLTQDRTLTLNFNGLGLVESSANDDLFAFYSAADGVHKAITRSDFLAGLGGDGGTIAGGENVGTGAGNVFKAVSGSNLQFRRIKADTGLTISVVGDDVVVGFGFLPSDLTVD
ncbi:MAG: hypothetical protein J0H34_22325 [Rhizobiales bacterium]|nr:hypothetical protein [Hyphomicrobiales bacterium]